MAELRSWEVHRNDAYDVNWTTIDVTISRWSKYQRGSALKFIHRWWDTAERKKDGAKQNQIFTPCATYQ